MKRRAAFVWLAALAAFALALRLGFWQLDRAAQKVEMQEAREQRARAPALRGAELPRSAGEAGAAQNRRAEVAGRWLAAHTVHLENRPMAGRVGFFVLTPLALDEGPAAGRVLLVQRGWWPRDAADRTRINAPAPTAERVSVHGRVALSPSRAFALAAEGAGAIRQNLDVLAYAHETRLPLLPWVLVQQEEGAAAATGSDGLLRQWPEPAADVHKHYGYAVQWFALAALVVLLVAWFQVVRPRRQARRGSNARAVPEEQESAQAQNAEKDRLQAT